MLLSTFLHFRGVGQKTEKRLWERGVLTWEDYSCQPNQAVLLPELTPVSHLSLSLAAYNAGDVAFFAKEIPSSAYYRIALTYPDETLFLDIETTGLSLYYDIVTIVGWSYGSKYGIYINGQDDSDLREVLNKSKIIVTFNGTIFDLKFIEKYFPDIVVPPVHIDLRFFSKRVGLTGGQKAIEKVIGYRRHEGVKDMRGEAAPILWHRYRRGENKALKRLIEYNHEDIEGMKYILDCCIDRLFEMESIPNKIRPSVCFSDRRSKIKWVSKTNNNSSGILIPTYRGTSKPLIDYDQLNAICPLNDLCVIGIDLVSSEKKASGCCKLNGDVADTCRLKSDDEIIQWATSGKVDLVSIDSPLSIPIGRTSFFDDDPCREFGIMRKCERILKRRGVSVYPCLIKSMQNLTRRGMTLAEKFRQEGIPVIESYPGAAQDIMGIPRKQAGLAYLAQGLNSFGINGDFVHGNVSHDELDAITSAIVGLFFWTGMFEALGNPLEEYLIIPDLNGDHDAWLNRTIIGINTVLAPQENILNKLKANDYALLNFNEVKCMQKNRIDLAKRAESVANDMGIDIDLQQKWLKKEYLEGYRNSKKIIIQGLISDEDHALVVETFGPSFHSLRNIQNRELITLLIQG
jgi:uncharacterized protein YprB with RNaseH-like and TPR domain/predicted nuclease with RNAse H fold